MAMQCADAQRREKILMRRLANKEQEFQDYVSQIAEYKAQQAPTALALRTALLDPAVNLLFERLKKELKATKAKLEETQNELSAWKFTPDSNTGKRLMAKCRLLYQENEELGKMTSNGRLAKLETELAMQKSFSEEVKKSQSELDDFLQELDEDVEGMQSTILFLQQELKTTRDRIQTLEKENIQLKQAHNNSSNNISSQKEICKNVATTVKAATNGKTSNNNANINNQLQPPISSSSKLETIVENACLETTSNNATAPTTQHTAADYYNGNNNEHKAVVIEQIILTPIDDISKNGGAAARLARKRNYEEESVPIACNVQELTPVVPVLREISAPRTLPPKKSKLRGIATRRSSQLEEEINLGLIPVTTPQVMDNTVTGMVSSEESIAAATAATAAAVTANVIDPAVVAAPQVVEDNTIDAAAAPAVAATSAGGAPARILTRRRSVRMQQNGGNGIDY
ncbi:pre-mRNA-splicing regulator female-lethal(2)D isoform X2 [Drosophila grimshawi]|nr:pre-mRNA-splicing regulator female-lethal(2)D isoform X2 [Drosophila grimshawi]